MRDELYESLCRYEAMAGLSDWQDETNPRQEDRDRAAYDKEYGLVLYPDGHRYTSYARMIRFLVEICGHAYDESLEGLVEHMCGMPTAYRADADAEHDSRQIGGGPSNIIEALFDLKVGRLIAGDDRFALDYNWRVTKNLTALRGASLMPNTESEKEPISDIRPPPGR